MKQLWVHPALRYTLYRNLDAPYTVISICLRTDGRYANVVWESHSCVSKRRTRGFSVTVIGARFLEGNSVLFLREKDEKMAFCLWMMEFRGLKSVFLTFHFCFSTIILIFVSYLLKDFHFLWLVIKRSSYPCWTR